jgi:L-histidine Nalpha-methyltransferase
VRDIIDIEFHSSVWGQASISALSQALTLRELPSSFLYKGAYSACLWERLHLAHAPSCQEEAEVSLHARGIHCLAKHLPNSMFQLVALGCGLAEKESLFLGQLGDRIERVGLVDVSVELVCEAKRRLIAMQPGLEVDGTVADLSQLVRWNDLIKEVGTAPRVMTLFGMVPNFDPRFLFERLSALMRPGDWLLLDANLIPDSTAGDESVPGSILSQYDNKECRQWLMASLSELGIYESSGRLVFSADLVEAGFPLPRIRADFEFEENVSIAIASEDQTFKRGESLSVFHSIRYGRETLPMLLRRAGFETIESWFSASGEDGVFLCRKAS